MTRLPAMALAITAAFALAACEDKALENQIGAGTASAAIGAIAATALGANKGWTAVAAAAAGTAGVLYARNRETNQCAYHTGDGETVTVGACQ